MGRRVERSTLVLGALLALGAPAKAQEPHHHGGSFGIGFIAADAVGDLGTIVDQGYGLELGAGWPMAANGHLRLRGDMGFIVYGLERIRYCDYGCRLASDLTTANSIVYAGIGPEVVVVHGPVQPYLRASAGLSYFVTSSSLDDHDGYGPYLQTTNYSDVVLRWTYGGGVRLRVGGHHRPVHLDFGVERQDHGLTNYLTRGDIVDNPDGSVTIYPNRTDADLMTFRFGISVGVSGGGG